ncbi:unnamed protein product [Mytilus coruscus]|uniref:Uncharacterized protein n=1 Tax=Mytilus coruscus TaxID=42192 RepID=A0A6J8C845_MYTCO|nr:unnamed protein product [Mytilus coruscus]
MLWKLSDKCNIGKREDMDKIIGIWGKQLRNISKYLQPVPYNISREACSDHFYPDFESNIRKVINYKTNTNSPCVENTHLDGHYVDSINNRNDDIPVIVTAASSDHFHEVQGLLKSIHTNLIPFYKNMKVIFYDIGLTQKENKAMKDYCKCEVRTFKFHQFPSHVRLLDAYAWKPLIIFEVLKDFKLIMWLDSCIRFFNQREYMIKENLDYIFEKTKLIGIQLQQSPRWIVSKHTKPDTFEYLDELECLYDYPELESGWIVISRNFFVVNAIIKPWVGCALTENCMTHPFPRFLKPCSKDLWKFLLWTKCHRFDQSVLNIIIIRIFNRLRKIIEFDGSRIASISRGDKVNYFPN